MTEEEEKQGGEVNPDALEAVFEEETVLEEDIFLPEEENDDTGIDIAFQANDEGYW